MSAYNVELFVYNSTDNSTTEQEIEQMSLNELLDYIYQTFKITHIDPRSLKINFSSSNSEYSILLISNTAKLIYDNDELRAIIIYQLNIASDESSLENLLISIEKPKWRFLIGPEYN